MAKLIEVNGQELSLKEIKEQILGNLEDTVTSDEMKNLIKAVIKVSAPKRKVESKTSIFRQLLLEKGSLTEDEIWTQFKWGKHEALSTAWGFRKKGNPEDFIYVDFNRDAEGVGIYSVVGTGPTPPEGYETRKKKKVATEETA